MQVVSAAAGGVARGHAVEAEVSWNCLAKVSPDCITAYGPVCTACEKLADDDTMADCKKTFNQQLCNAEPIPQSMLCEGSKSCLEFVPKCNWAAVRCKGYVRAGGPQGCPVNVAAHAEQAVNERAAYFSRAAKTERFDHRATASAHSASERDECVPKTPPAGKGKQTSKRKDADPQERPETNQRGESHEGQGEGGKGKACKRRGVDRHKQSEMMKRRDSHEQRPGRAQPAAGSGEDALRTQSEVFLSMVQRADE